MISTFKKLLRPLASLYLTVALLLLSMLLVYAGTTVQKQMGIQDVQKQFFRSWVARVPLDPFLRPFAQAGDTTFHRGFWIIGGYGLIALLLANLLAAHAVRFKINWKRSGIIMIHLGLIVLLVGEIFAGLWSVESVMQIDTGQTVTYSSDIRHVELSVTDPTPADHDNVTVIDDSVLKPGAVIHPAGLPFDIRVDDYFPNSMIVGPQQSDKDAVAKATTGLNQKLRIRPEAKVSGTDGGGQTDMASAFVTVSSKGRVLGTYCLTQWDMAIPGLIKPEPVTVDGKTYVLDLRFRRYYKPYTLTLVKFTHDRYPGTDVASNFASLVRLVDPARHVDRTVRIWMNHPLTYRGETFYQQNFGNHDRTSVLQVTRNPAWPMPYVGLALGLEGMLIHFGMNLVVFLRRRSAGGAARAPAGRSASSAYTLKPTRNRIAWACGIGGVVFVLLVFVGFCASPSVEEEGFDLTSFGQLPVMSGGRVMPLDTLARTSLKVISNRETFKDAKGKTHPAIRWLADTLTHAPGSDEYDVIRIDHPEIISQLGLDTNKKYFSVKDIQAHQQTIQEQYDLASKVPEKQRDLFQKRMMELFEHVETYGELRMPLSLMLVPPKAEGGDWSPLVTMGPGNQPEIAPGAEQLGPILQAYMEGKPHDFNKAVAAYHKSLSGRMPGVMAKVDYESFFNKVEPFYLCLWFYVLVFVLVLFSWLGGRKYFWSAAMGVLVVTLLIHTFGLASRVYLTGRGPVTNLYSSALFIAWAAVLLAIGLEIIYRNGLGAALAAVVGFGSLLIAHYLGSDGDTMKPVVAVLATNFWLWTHVPCVTLGYASTLLAGSLAIAYVLMGIFTDWLDKETAQSLARMVYGIVCFAMLFSFVGTILGGIWADYSWGRFWGWDPKENGAILIVIWNAIILHARWSGLVRQRGMMLLAIVGNMVTGWSWFGTNLLGIGLHSYGFMEGAATGLIAAWLVHLGIIGMGLIPQRLWRSFASQPVQRRPAAVGR